MSLFRLLLFFFHIVNLACGPRFHFKDIIYLYLFQLDFPYFTVYLNVIKSDTVLTALIIKLNKNIEDINETRLNGNIPQVRISLVGIKFFLTVPPQVFNQVVSVLNVCPPYPLVVAYFSARGITQEKESADSFF